MTKFSLRIKLRENLYFVDYLIYVPVVLGVNENYLQRFAKLRKFIQFLGIYVIKISWKKNIKVQVPFYGHQNAYNAITVILYR